VCDLETSRMGAPYIYDISHLRVKMKRALFNNVVVRSLPTWEVRVSNLGRGNQETLDSVTLKGLMSQIRQCEQIESNQYICKVCHYVKYL